MTETTPRHGVELSPLRGEVVADEHAAQVVAPGDDVAARSLATGLDPPRSAPDSFRHVLPGDDPDEDRLRANRRHLDRLRASGRYVALPGPTLAVLALDHPHGRAAAAPGRTVAVVGDVDVAAYRDGRILPHERVDEARVEALARYLEVVGAASTPVCVTHRPHPAVTATTDAVLAGPPDLRFTLNDGTGVTLHLVTEEARRRPLVEAIRSTGPLYLADGHHRAAAVARLTGSGADLRVLSAVVPTDHLRVAAFHRRVDPTGPVSPDAVLDLLRRRGATVDALPGPGGPTEPGVALLVVGGRWWAVDLSRAHGDAPRDELDVEVARRELIDPLLELAGPGAVEVAIPAPVGVEAVTRDGSIGVVLHPPTIEDVLAIADARGVMPPKTTYLAPKVPAGILLRPR